MLFSLALFVTVDARSGAKSEDLPSALPAFVPPPGGGGKFVLRSFDGETVPTRNYSIKCALGELPNFSARRLDDCHSASVVDVVGWPNVGLLHFAIDPNDAQISDGTRAELRDLFEAHNGDEQWYRFSTLLPRNFPSDQAPGVVLAQWHERLASGDALRPPLALRLVGGKFAVTVWNADIYREQAGDGDGATVYRGDVDPRGMINEFVFRIAWNANATGGVTAWRRDGCLLPTPRCQAGPWQQIIKYAGPIGYPQAAGYYFKFGVYTTHHFTERLAVYHFGYRSGQSAASIGTREAIFLQPASESVMHLPPRN